MNLALAVTAPARAPDPIKPLQMSQRMIGCLLATGAIYSASDLFAGVYGQRLDEDHSSVGTINISIMHLRTWLKPHRIEIVFVPARGYFVWASQLDALAALLLQECDRHGYAEMAKRLRAVARY
jgi:hypothetical protein